jgi:hypothetical protein
MLEARAVARPRRVRTQPPRRVSLAQAVHEDRRAWRGVGERARELRRVDGQIGAAVTDRHRQREVAARGGEGIAEIAVEDAQREAAAPRLGQRRGIVARRKGERRPRAAR